MDNQRLLLFLALSLVVLFIWEAWQERNIPQPVLVESEQQNTPRSAITDGALPEMPMDGAPEIALSESQNLATPKLPEREQANEKQAQIKLQQGKRLRVVTDVLDLDIDTVGGDIRRAFFPIYPISADKPDEPFPFMNDRLPRFFIAQSGLLSSADAPDHRAIYQAEKAEYILNAAENVLIVPLTWTSPSGLKVTKTFTFKRGDYLVSINHIIENKTGKLWQGRQYGQFQRTEYDEPGKSRLLYTFSGGAVSTPESPYEKIDFDEMAEWKPEQSYTTNGWIAMLQHYFVSAWVPSTQNSANHFYTRATSDQRYILGMTEEQRSVESGAIEEFRTQLYIGPKDQDILEKIAPNLELTVDYGFLYIIAKPLFWLLQQIHSLVGNWGWAIIFLTFLIKLIFYKLSEASYRSMANMRKLAPKFQSIRERYGDDRQRMSQAMMEIYKKEKVNPMSGCWPMLVQIPVFISLYWVLLESVELRQADFMLWITDLSSKDPFYVLPLLMGASMYVQQKLSANPSLDPMHQKIMQFLPLIFTLFFMLFPAGLVLYWVVNNILSITQQWYITRKIENATK